MKKININIKNILYGIGVLYAIGILGKTYYDRLKLPAGICPIDNNRGLMISGIIVLILVTIITSIIDHKQKNNE